MELNSIFFPVPAVDWEPFDLHGRLVFIPKESDKLSPALHSKLLNSKLQSPARSSDSLASTVPVFSTLKFVNGMTDRLSSMCDADARIVKQAALQPRDSESGETKYIRIISKSNLLENDDEACPIASPKKVFNSNEKIEMGVSASKKSFKPSRLSPKKLQTDNDFDKLDDNSQMSEITPREQLDLSIAVSRKGAHNNHILTKETITPIKGIKNQMAGSMKPKPIAPPRTPSNDLLSPEQRSSRRFFENSRGDEYSKTSNKPVNSMTERPKHDMPSNKNISFLRDYLGKGNINNVQDVHQTSKYKKIDDSSPTNTTTFNNSLTNKDNSKINLLKYHQNLEEKHARECKARQEYNSSIVPSKMNKIPCLLSKPHLGSDSLLIYFHANGEDIYKCSTICSQLSSTLNVDRPLQDKCLGARVSGLQYIRVGACLRRFYHPRCGNPHGVCQKLAFYSTRENSHCRQVYRHWAGVSSRCKVQYCWFSLNIAFYVNKRGGF